MKAIIFSHVLIPFYLKLTFMNVKYPVGIPAAGLPAVGLPSGGPTRNGPTRSGPTRSGHTQWAYPLGDGNYPLIEPLFHRIGNSIRKIRQSRKAGCHCHVKRDQIAPLILFVLFDWITQP